MAPPCLYVEVIREFRLLHNILKHIIAIFNIIYTHTSLQ